MSWDSGLSWAIVTWDCNGPSINWFETEKEARTEAERVVNTGNTSTALILYLNDVFETPPPIAQSAKWRSKP